MIGVSCTNFCTESVEHWAGRIRKDFRLWEIFSEAEHIVYKDTQHIAEILESNGLECQVHTPICDWNPGAMSERLREASMQETFANIEAAQELGVKVVTVHPGLASLAVKGTNQKAAEYAKESMRRLDRFMEGRPLVAAIENMPSMPFYLGRTAEQLADLVEGTDLRICFDIGHANTMGQIDDMIDTFGDRIANVHIHDNHGEKDEHLTIGDGDIDFERVVKRLSNYKGNWIIESKDYESAVQSSLRLNRLLS